MQQSEKLEGQRTKNQATTTAATSARQRICR